MHFNDFLNLNLFLTVLLILIEHCEGCVYQLLINKCVMNDMWCLCLLQILKLIFLMMTTSCDDISRFLSLKCTASVC